jgi:hypothetical protein
MFGYTAVQASSMFIDDPATEVSFLQDDRTKIDPDELPDPVKEKIKSDNNIKSKNISEAYTERADNQMYYVVKFERDQDGQEVTKRFDARGNEAAMDDRGRGQRPAQQPGQQGAPGQERPQGQTPPGEGAPQQGAPGQQGSPTQGTPGSERPVPNE